MTHDPSACVSAPSYASLPFPFLRFLQRALPAPGVSQKVICPCGLVRGPQHSCLHVLEHKSCHAPSRALSGRQPCVSVRFWPGTLQYVPTQVATVTWSGRGVLAGAGSLHHWLLFTWLPAPREALRQIRSRTAGASGRPAPLGSLSWSRVPRTETPSRLLAAWLQLSWPAPGL